MKSINELTSEDSEVLATILKYDIPYAEGVKEELIECYSPDIEGLTLGKYMPIKLFFTGLHWLSKQGYDLSELIKNIGIESNIDFYPKEIQRLKTELDNANAIVSKLSKPPTAHTEELSREVKSAEEVLKWHGVPIPEYPDGRKSLFAAMEEYASQFTPHKEGYSVDGWVRVEDGLPELRVPVLVYMSYGKIDTCYWTGELWNQSVRPQHSNGSVTHWQPLPQPPTKKHT